MLTPNKLEKAQTFWNWFANNRFAFEFMSDIEPTQKNKLIDMCVHEMEKYCEGLGPIFCPEVSERGDFRFVVSASGDPSLFQQAKDLAAQAPDIPNWNIVGLIPPIQEGQALRFNVADFVLDPNQIGVTLVDVGGYSNRLGILVGLQEFDEDQPELMVEVRNTIVQLISNICGEEMVGNHIQFLELREFPENPSASGYYKMYNLPEMIQHYQEEYPALLKAS